MKRTIGLLLFGLLFQHGLADVSHLHGSSHNHYLPPPIQNLPIEQDYNGIDSQPHNGHNNRGYLPPYQDQQHNENSNDYHQPRDRQQYQNPYDHNIEVSYHNDFGIKQANGQSHGGHGHHDHQEHQDQDDHHSNDHEHVEIDEQQLEPVFPSNFNVGPSGGPQGNTQNQMNPNRGEDQSILLGQYPHNQLPESNAAPFSHPQNEPSNLKYDSHENGYQYNPPAQSARDLLYPNQRSPEVGNAHQLPTGGPQNGYLPPNREISNGHSPQSHPSHGNLHEVPNYQTGHLPQQPQQDYLPPNPHNHGHQSYLPPVQPTHLDHQPQGHLDQTSHGVNNIQAGSQQGYLPPNGPHNTYDNSGDLQPNYPLPLDGGDQPKHSNALHIVSPPQLGLSIEEPHVKFTDAGHVNVPLPIPQVGYFFVPGVVTRIPNLNEEQLHGVRPAINIPAITPQPIQHISSPEYTRSFLLPKANKPIQGTTSQMIIMPSIQTMQNARSQGMLHSTIFQQNPQNLRSTNSPLHLQTTNAYLPPLHHGQQQNPYHDRPLNDLQQQNLNDVQEQDFIPPDNLSNSGLRLQNIARSEVSNPSNQQKEGPLNDYETGAHLPVVPGGHQNTNLGRGYLPPDNYNQMTSLQTYMDGVHTSDRYGSSHYHHPPPNQNLEAPPAIPPPMYSKPSAIRAYAPGMAYNVVTNTPFTTFTQPGYLPPADQTNSIGLQLNDEAKQSLASIMPRDNTIFPLDDDDIDVPRLMEQLRGRIRTVQIISNHANSVKNIKVLETADNTGVKTIKILGAADEDPMGEHKVIRIVSKGPHPDGTVQTLKIFTDHKEVNLPTQNAYLPPPREKDTYNRVLRHSQEPRLRS